MGVLDNRISDFSARRPFAEQRDPSTTERKQSQIWLNVGYYVGDTFIGVPVGLGIDTMRDAPVRGQNEEFNKIRLAQNELLKQLQKQGGKLQPGESITIPLTVELRRVNEALEIGKADNEFIVDFSKLMAVGAEPQPQAAE